MVPHPLIFKSRDFEEGQMMPAKFTCDSGTSAVGVIPPFDIQGVVPEAKSLALIMDDPDAPRGTWVHWVKWNMPPDLGEIEEGKEPLGISGKGTGGSLTYEGPCPPSGTHRYLFKLYVLDSVLTLREGSSKEDVLAAIEGHLLQEAICFGVYQRN